MVTVQHKDNIYQYAPRSCSWPRLGACRCRGSTRGWSRPSRPHRAARRRTGCQGGSLQTPRPLSWTSTPGPPRPGLIEEYRDSGGSPSDYVPSVIVEVVVVVVVLVFVAFLWCNLQQLKWSGCYFFVDPTTTFVQEGRRSLDTSLFYLVISYIFIVLYGGQKI